MPAAVTTESLAETIGVKPTSIRVRLCRTGSYFGLRPIKLPNGRLLWPADAIDRLATYRPASPASPATLDPPARRPRRLSLPRPVEVQEGAS